MTQDEWDNEGMKKVPGKGKTLLPLPGEVILGFTKEGTLELGLSKWVRVFQVSDGEDLYKQKEKTFIGKSTIAFKDPLYAWLW